MGCTVLQLTVKVVGGESQFFDALQQITHHDVASLIAATPGLHWKIWLHNIATLEITGIYLFEAEQHIAPYLEAITPQLQAMPFDLQITPMYWAINAEATKITRGSSLILGAYSN